MATSGTYAYSDTAREIIDDAMMYLGVLADGETLESSHLALAIRALNRILKQWSAEGVGPEHLIKTATLFPQYNTANYTLSSTGENWTLSPVITDVKTAAVTGASTVVLTSITGMSSGDYVGVELDDGTVQWTTINGAPAALTITLTDVLTDDVAVGNAVYTYTTKAQMPKEVIEIRTRDADNVDTPIRLISRQEYQALALKTSLGIPNVAFVDKQLSYWELYLWPVPEDVTRTIRLSVEYPIEDILIGGNDIDIPVQYGRALVFALARDLAVPFGRLDMMETLTAMAYDAKSTVMAFDMDDSPVTFAPAR